MLCNDKHQHLLNHTNTGTHICTKSESHSICVEDICVCCVCVDVDVVAIAPTLRHTHPHTLIELVFSKFFSLFLLAIWPFLLLLTSCPVTTFKLSMRGDPSGTAGYVFMMQCVYTHIRRCACMCVKCKNQAFLIAWWKFIVQCKLLKFQVVYFYFFKQLPQLLTTSLLPLLIMFALSFKTFILIKFSQLYVSITEFNCHYTEPFGCISCCFCFSLSFYVQDSCIPLFRLKAK